MLVRKMFPNGKLSLTINVYSTIGLIYLCCLTHVTARIHIPVEDILSSRVEGCTIAVTGGLGTPQPLLIVPGTEQFLMPSARDGIVRLQSGQSIELFCTYGFNETIADEDTVFAECSTDNKFIYNDETYEFSDFTCKSYPYHTARRRPDRFCYDGASVIEVGFIVHERFLPVFDICHDEQLASTLYSHYQLTPLNAGYQSGFPRPSFIQGDFFGADYVNGLYTKVEQMNTIGRVLGEERLLELFDDSRDIYLARGHLAAKVDFIYGSQQRSTFYFVNVAPQWQSFNGGNWERVESGTRTFVADRNINVEVYTGTFDVLRLKDVNGNYHPIYLQYDENNNGRIPVPKFYYKVLFEWSTQLGIVIIGVNNPHVTDEELIREYRICSDVSDQITWLNWEPRNKLKGYMMACDVNHFFQIVKHLPYEIKTKGLLL